MGNIGNNDFGICEARFEGILPMMGFKDLDDVDDEVLDASRQIGGGRIGAVTRFDV